MLPNLIGFFLTTEEKLHETASLLNASDIFLLLQAVQGIIEKESEFRKKRFPYSKKLKIKVNIMTYGVLAMTCKTKESAEKLLKEMEEKQLK